MKKDNRLLYLSIDKYIEDNFIDENEILSLNESMEIISSKFKKEPIKIMSDVYAEKRFVPDIKQTFQELLFQFIDNKQLDEVEVYKKALVDRRLFSKIRSNINYQPAKKTVIAFVLAIELDIYETEDLLQSAGYTLSKSILFDVLILYCIENKIYDLLKVNEILLHYDQSLINV